MHMIYINAPTNRAKMRLWHANRAKQPNFSYLTLQRSFIVKSPLQAPSLYYKESISYNDSLNLYHSRSRTNLNLISRNFTSKSYAPNGNCVPSNPNHQHNALKGKQYPIRADGKRSTPIARITSDEVIEIYNELKEAREFSTTFELILSDLKARRMLRSLPELMSKIATDSSMIQRMTHDDLINAYKLVVFAPSKCLDTLSVLIDLGLQVSVEMWHRIAKSITLLYDTANIPNGGRDNRVQHQQQQNNDDDHDIINTDSFKYMDVYKPEDFFDNNGKVMKRYVDILMDNATIKSQDCLIIAMKHFLAIEKYQHVNRVVKIIDELYGSACKEYYFEMIVDRITSSTSRDSLKYLDQVSTFPEKQYDKHMLLINLYRRLHRRTTFRHSKYVASCLSMHYHHLSVKERKTPKHANRINIEDDMLQHHDHPNYSYLDEAYDVAIDACKNVVNIGYHQQDMLFAELIKHNRQDDASYLLSQFQLAFLYDIRTFSRVMMVWRNHGLIQASYDSLRHAIASGFEPSARTLKYIIDMDAYNFMVHDPTCAVGVKMIEQMNKDKKIDDMMRWYAAIMCLAESRALVSITMLYHDNIQHIMASYQSSNERMVLSSLDMVDKYMFDNIIASIIRLSIREDVMKNLQSTNMQYLTSIEMQMVHFIDKINYPVLYESLKMMLPHFSSASLEHILQQEIRFYSIRYKKHEILRIMKNQLIYRDEYCELPVLSGIIQNVKNDESNNYMVTIRFILLTYFDTMKPTIRIYSEVINSHDCRDNVQMILEFGCSVANIIIARAEAKLSSSSSSSSSSVTKSQASDHPSIYLFLCCLERLAPLIQDGQARILDDDYVFNMGHRLITAIHYSNAIIQINVLSDLITLGSNMLMDGKPVIAKLVFLMQVTLHDGRSRVFPYQKVKAILDYIATLDHQHHHWLVRMYQIHPALMILRCMTIDHADALFHALSMENEHQLLITIFSTVCKNHDALGSYVASSSEFWSLFIRSVAMMKSSKIDVGGQHDHDMSINQSLQQCIKDVYDRRLFNNDMMVTIFNELLASKLDMEALFLIDTVIADYLPSPSRPSKVVTIQTPSQANQVSSHINISKETWIAVLDQVKALHSQATSRITDHVDDKTSGSYISKFESIVEALTRVIQL